MHGFVARAASRYRNLAAGRGRLRRPTMRKSIGRRAADYRGASLDWPRLLRPRRVALTLNTIEEASLDDAVIQLAGNGQALDLTLPGPNS